MCVNSTISAFGLNGLDVVEVVALIGAVGRDLRGVPPVRSGRPRPGRGPWPVESAQGHAVDRLTGRRTDGIHHPLACRARARNSPSWAQCCTPLLLAGRNIEKRPS